MKVVIDSISNREIAFAFWVGVALLATLLSRDVRNSIARLLTSIFAKYVRSNLAILIVYTLIIVWFLHSKNYWDFSLLKITLFWFFALALSVFFKMTEISNMRFFIKLLRNQVSLTIVIAFVVETYTFSLPIELALTLFLLFFLAMAATAKVSQKAEYQSVIKLSNFIVQSIIYVFILHAVYMLITDPAQVFRSESMKEILLPLALTIFIIPVFYVLTMRLNYSSIFYTFNHTIDDSQKKKELKQKVISVAGLSLSKSYQIRKKINWFSPPNVEDIPGMLVEV